MVFINKYTELQTYTYSKEFTEEGKSFIYSLGKSNDQGAIVKLDSEGEIVWEKSLSYDLKEPLSLGKIIQLNVVRQGSKQSAQYIIFARSAKGNFLISINSNGEVLWFKNIIWEHRIYSLFIEPLSNNSFSGFHLVLSNYQGNNFYAKIDADGISHFSANLISKPGFIVRAIHSHNKGLAVAGELYNSSYGVVFDIHGDEDVVISSAQTINRKLSINSLQFDYRNSLYLISGSLQDKRSSSFIGSISYHTLNFKTFSNLGFPNSRDLQLGNNGFYLLRTESGRMGILYSLDLNLNINWAKKLQDSNSDIGPIHFTFNKETNRITATGNTQYPTIIHTENTFDSCKTVEIQESLNKISIKVDKIRITLEKSNLKLEDLKLSTKQLKSDRIEFCDGSGTDPDSPGDTDTSSHDFTISKNTELQSSHIYMQAAGSTGDDGSVKGIHLRWIFKNYLGQTHLPKGNYATTPNHFNKENDFVKIYRAPYISSQITLDFNNPADIVDNQNQYWVYFINHKQFYVYFRNTVKYNQVLATVKPTDPIGFLKSYGSELIEIEHKTELSFKIILATNNSNSETKIESFSVDTNIVTATKYLSSRNIFVGNTGTIEEENIRSIRYRVSSGIINRIQFEFYSEALAAIQNSLEYLGSFSLTKNDIIATNRLELNETVNGQWDRFNGGDKVNTNNYLDKWNGEEVYSYSNPDSDSQEYYEYFDRNLKTLVKRYMQLSDLDVDNPQANEAIPFEELSNDDQEDDFTDISNLNLINMSSMDFHMARILGLGHVDSSIDTSNNNQKYFYLAEYTTFVNINNGELDDDAEEMQHLYLSLPTAIINERLPHPLDLIEPKCGIVRENPLEQMSCSLNENKDKGYSEDGKERFISLFLDELPENPTNVDFFIEETTFSTSEKTIPVFAGIEYKKVENTNWNRPELSNTDSYKNFPGGTDSINETVPLYLPEPNQAVFIHREREDGEHVYGSYGVNWFSRSQESEITWNVETILKPKNRLLPPSNVKATLIIEESPLMLSSAEEQQLFEAIDELEPDKTMIRLTFDHNIVQDLITYQINDESMGTFSNPLDSDAIFPDDKEIYAEEIELFFRDKTPRTVSGKIKNIIPYTNSQQMVILTENYLQVSNNTVIVPHIPIDEFPNFVGSILMFNGDKYIIDQVEASSVSGEGPRFRVYKKAVSESMLNNTELDVTIPLTIPEVIGNVLFNTIENMATISNWGASNPFSYKLQIGYNQIHREVIEDAENANGTIEQILEKSRGFWFDSTIDVEMKDGVHLGFYKITSNDLGNIILNDHPQFLTHNINWNKGIVRIHTQEHSLGKRRVLEVVKIENIGSDTEPLVIYVFDQGFLDVDESGNRLNEQIITGSNVEINLYPSYKMYLYKDAMHSLITQDNILPQQGEGMKYTIFGLRTIDNLDPVLYVDPIYKSKMSTPAVMFAQEIVKPETPVLTIPDVFIYATRPDTFGRSTFTLKPTFIHEPHAVIFYRTNEHAILNSLYNQITVNKIKNELKALESDGYAVNRWQTFLQFNFNTENYTFQYPNKIALFKTINDVIIYLNERYGTSRDLINLDDVGTIAPSDIVFTDASGNGVTLLEYVKYAVFNSFVPLTEIPLIYEYINENNQPVNKKQVIRDAKGDLLSPDDIDFDIAPMAKKFSEGGVTGIQFTDFTLDGTSDNLYFYALREAGSTMEMGDFSRIIGPIKLVNTKPPKSPDIKRIIPVLENTVLDIKPGITIEINAYPSVQNIKQIRLYRTLDSSKSLAIRSMDLIKTIDLTLDGQIDNNIWKVKDEFEDLGYIPYSDPLYYRITVLREVEYVDKGNIADGSNPLKIEYAPSIPSKLLISTVVESSNPESPKLLYSFDENSSSIIDNVILQWERTCYKGKYYIYKMNSQGNWVKIHELESNQETINLPLVDTSLEDGTLLISSNENNPIYHHFKVIAENTSGMLSTEEHILTIPQNTTP